MGQPLPPRPPRDPKQVVEYANAILDEPLLLPLYERGGPDAVLAALRQSATYVPPPPPRPSRPSPSIAIHF